MPPLSFPSRGEFKHGYKIKTVYDKLEDRTTVTLGYLWYDAEGFTNISQYSMSPRFSYSGQTPPAQHDSLLIEMVIEAQLELNQKELPGDLGGVFKFARPDQRSLVLLLDGKTRLAIGDGVHSGRVSGSDIVGQRHLIETLVYRVPVRDWLAIANAGLIEGRFGSKSFKLDKQKQFEALRDFTSRMVAAP